MQSDDIQQLTETLKPYARELGYGTIQLFVKVHDGGIFNIDEQKYTTIKTTNGNVDATASIIKLIKGMQESCLQSGKSGSLTFTIDFNNEGQSTKLVVNDIGKHRIK
jgi:hypothetical protein